MYIYIYTYIHTYIYIYIYTHIHTFIKILNINYVYARFAIKPIGGRRPSSTNNDDDNNNNDDDDTYNKMIINAISNSMSSLLKLYCRCLFYWLPNTPELDG